MPLVSEFFGVKIYMYWDEHVPPHFHAHYAKHKALVSIENASVLKGTLPVKPLKLVLAWCEIHKEELMTNWNSAIGHGKITAIDPLR